MRSPPGTRLIPHALAAVAIATAVGCGEGTVPVPEREGAFKSAASVRAERRAYDGAPPTVRHESFGMTCSACHNAQGQSVSGVGFAPASPHESTPKAGNTLRCSQCHVIVTTDGLFVPSEFVGLGQDLSAGGRATPGAPPTIPHRTLMRESCNACHTGPGAREEIRTSHPERRRCRQCHVPVTSRESFESTLGEGLGEQ
jgi:cytochrome c-type protein NapB